MASYQHQSHFLFCVQSLFSFPLFDRNKPFPRRGFHGNLLFRKGISKIHKVHGDPERLFQFPIPLIFQVRLCIGIYWLFQTHVIFSSGASLFLGYRLLPVHVPGIRRNRSVFFLQKAEVSILPAPLDGFQQNTIFYFSIFPSRHPGFDICLPYLTGCTPGSPAKNGPPNHVRFERIFRFRGEQYQVNWFLRTWPESTNGELCNFYSHRTHTRKRLIGGRTPEQPL